MPTMYLFALVALGFIVINNPTFGIMLVIGYISIIIFNGDYGYEKEDPIDSTKSALNFIDKALAELERTPQYHGNMYMSKHDKQTYIKSIKWFDKRTECFANNNNECYVCGSQSNLEIHHLDYDTLGDEDPECLIPLCRECHQLQHNHHGYDRSTSYYEIIYH